MVSIFHIFQILNIEKISICGLDWEVIAHPPYSPDLAPLDFYIFNDWSYDYFTLSHRIYSSVQSTYIQCILITL